MKLDELRKQVRDLYTTVVISQSSGSLLARELEQAMAADDVRSLRRAVSSWLKLPPRQTQAMLRRVAMLHAPVIRAGFEASRLAATSLLTLVRHPSFKRLVEAARVLERLSDSSHPLALATAPRAFVEASNELSASELRSRIRLFVPPARLTSLH